MEFQPRVESVQDLRRSVRTFQKGTLDDQRDAFGSNPVYFLHLRTPKGHRFAPSKFGAYVGLSVADYHQKRVKKHYTGGENQKWIAGVMGQPWTLLSSASKSTQAAFSEWFTSTTGRALPDRNLYLMESIVRTVPARRQRRRKAATQEEEPRVPFAGRAT